MTLRVSWLTKSKSGPAKGPTVWLRTVQVPRETPHTNLRHYRQTDSHQSSRSAHRIRAPQTDWESTRFTENSKYSLRAPKDELKVIQVHRGPIMTDRRVHRLTKNQLGSRSAPQTQKAPQTDRNLLGLRRPHRPTEINLSLRRAPQNYWGLHRPTGSRLRSHRLHRLTKGPTDWLKATLVHGESHTIT